MPKLPGIGYKDALRVLRKAGFAVVREGSHTVMSNGATLLVIPRHTVINAYTMGDIARRAGMTPEEFRRFL